MYPAQSAAMQMRTITELRNHYNLPEDLWTSFTAIAGNPGEDLRLLAVLPAHVVSAALERAPLPDGNPLSAVQASHVGLIYNLAKRIQHTSEGGDWDTWAGREEAEKLLNGEAIDGIQREGDPTRLEEKDKVLVIDLFAGLGGFTLALSKAGVGYSHLGVVEKDANCRRLMRRAHPLAQFFSDIEKFGRKEILSLVKKVPGITGIAVGGGSPCQGLSKLSSKRQHLKDAGSKLFYEASRVFKEIDEVAQELKLWVLKLLENVIADKDDIREMNRELKMDGALMVDAQYLSRARRPRLFWVSVRPTEVSDVEQGDQFRYPPYTYKDEYMVLTPSCELRPFNAREREVLMGYQPGHCRRLLKKPPIGAAEEREAEDLQCSAIGNSFHTNAVARLLDHCFATMGLKQRKGADEPPLEEDCGPGPEVSEHDDSISVGGALLAESMESKTRSAKLLAEELHDDRKLGSLLVGAYLRRQEFRGSDVRLDISALYRPDSFPRGSVEPSRWIWHRSHSFPFKDKDHINILELRSLVHTFEWRIRNHTFGDCRWPWPLRAAVARAA
eukprot:s851_g12.t1